MTYKLKSSETSNLSTVKTTSKKTYSYDENGNNIKEVDSIKNITKEMNYDVDNRLDTYTLTENDKTTTQSNLYNGDGQRIQKSEGDNSINYYYQNGSVLYTTDKDEKKTSHNFVGLEGNTISTMRYDLTGLEYYVYNKDIKGSTTNIVDNNKNAKISYKYSDFGETEEIGDTDFYNEIAYTGGIYDESTSLYYLNARYYNPEDARFITQDTYRGEINEPSSLHLYAYCDNNPINYVDPSGHIATYIVGAVIGAVIGAVGGYYLGKWLANKLGLKGNIKSVFIAGVAALSGASIAAIGYFVGPYIAKSWLSASLARLLKGSYKRVGTISKFKINNHINVPKHLWNRVLKNPSNTNVKNLVYKAIKNGKWTLKKSGSVEINYKYKKEIQYKDVNSRIICEEYLEDETGSLRDYKFHCSKSKVHMIEIHTDRFTNHKENYYDSEWNELDVICKLQKVDYISKPENLEQMKKLAISLSRNLPYVRVDLYRVNNKIYFGELTFTPANGTDPMYPLSEDIKLAQAIDLSEY